MNCEGQGQEKSPHNSQGECSAGEEAGQAEGSQGSTVSWLQGGQGLRRRGCKTASCQEGTQGEDGGETLGLDHVLTQP